MLVYVLNHQGKKLMPCKPRKARILLRDKKAKVVNLQPFTIQLLYPSSGYVQEVVIGIDKGSKFTGFSCVGNNKVLLSGQINHRTDVKSKMEDRAGCRRQRRNRKWYRPARFDNRSNSRKVERVLPSIKTNIDEVLRVINKINLPITKIYIEDVQIDVAKLNNPELTGKDYQRSNRLDENLRIATLIRDGYTCQLCKASKVKLEAHHIKYKRDGGKDTIKNMITLCSKCHSKVHKNNIKITIGVDNFKDTIAQRTMQGKSYLYKSLNKYDLGKVYGYETSYYRKQLELPKEHDVDALCIALLRTGLIVNWDRDNYYEINFRPRQTRKLYHTLPRKSLGRIKYQVNDELDGFRKGDIVLVKGKYRKQINSIYSSGRVAFKRVDGEPGDSLTKDCKLLEKQKTIIWKKVI